MTTQTSTEDSVDSENQERLKQITHKLTMSAASYMADNLTVSDLKFLFEHFAPLQKLINGLVTTLPAPAPISTPAAQADNTNALQTEINAAQKELSEIKDKLTKTEASVVEKENSLTSIQSQLSKTETKLAETVASLNEKDTSLVSIKAKLLDTEDIAKKKSEEATAAMEKCMASAQSLLADKNKLTEKNKQYKTELDLIKQRLQASKAALASRPELALLREDTVLAQALSLSPLPIEDIEALIHIVAVLAQRDNLTVLWDALKNRCENENRPANAAERTLLSTALAWYNYNWRTHPYNLIEVSPTAAYDFKVHLRSRNTNTGEIIAAQHLPGITGSGNEQVRKPLVITR